MKLSGYDDSLAEELTQESFYQAFISFQRFRGECTVKTWLCQIAKNTYFSYVRAHARQAALKEKLKPRQEEKPVSLAVEEKQIAAHIRGIIEGLDARSKSIVEYRLFCELPYREVGELLGIREATAKVLYSRAKAKIQKQLKEEYGYEI